MLNVFKKRLGARIILYLMIGVTFFGILMGYYVYRDSRLRRESETNLYRIHGKTLIRNIAANVNVFFGILSMNPEALAAEAQSLFEDPTVSYVVFYKQESSEKPPEVVYEKYREGITAAQFSFGVPNLKSGEEGAAVQEIESSAGEAFLDFRAEVREVQATSEEKGDVVGFVRGGISIESLNTQVRQSRIEGFALIAAALVLGLLLVVGTLRSVMPPINRLAKTARRFGKGDYKVQVEVTSEDEIGLLSQTFNEMVTNIRSHNERSKNLIENIYDAIMLLTEITEKLRAITTEQATGTAEQATIVQEVVSTTGEIAATASNIAGAAESVNDTARKTSEVCTKGKEYISGAVSGMNHIHDQVARVTEKIKALSGQVERIGGVIEIIEEISGQTNLLALNAALEAAGAGEAGRRFSVVAGEVRRLAARTLEFTESVKEVIENIQNSTIQMVGMADEQTAYVADGTNAVERMGEYFGHILEMVNTTLKASTEINLITKQQATASDQMVTSIRGVEEVAREVEKGGKDIEMLVIELKTLTDHLQSQIEEKNAIASNPDAENSEQI